MRSEKQQANIDQARKFRIRVIDIEPDKKLKAAYDKYFEWAIALYGRAADFPTWRRIEASISSH